MILICLFPLKELLNLLGSPPEKKSPNNESVQVLGIFLSILI